MGFLYDAHYANYYEVGHTECIRQLGLTYKAIEEAGVLMPVTDLQMKFLLPARYDELITVITTIPVIPEWRMVVQAELKNEKEEVINKAEVKLAFLDAIHHKICRAPEALVQKLAPFY